MRLTCTLLSLYANSDLIKVTGEVCVYMSLFSFQFVTTVVSCCPAELKQEVNGKKETLKGFNVKLQDTVLFPEGGGQVSWFFKLLV